MCYFVRITAQDIPYHFTHCVVRHIQHSANFISTADSSVTVIILYRSYNSITTSSTIATETGFLPLTRLMSNEPVSANLGMIFRRPFVLI